MTKELFEKMCELEYEDLAELLKDGITQMQIKAYGAGYEQGKFDADNVKATTLLANATANYGEPAETSQQARDRIVEQAKKDVVVITSNMKSISIKWEGNSSYRNLLTFPEFIVNKEKRTVAVLVRRYFKRSNIIERGIAKCAPDDCFNVHIGKAIALRRALGLEVPTDYLNAPQPTEVRVGDVVKFDGRHITVCPGDRLYRHYEDLCAIDSVVAETSEIIDDSREV